MVRYTQRTKTLEQYLRDVKKHPLLTVEEEVEIAGRARNGCSESFSKLVNSNLRFVVHVAKEYQYQGIPLMDLIQEGNIGLVKAAKRFDETKGFKFISYAVWWIRQAVLGILMESNKVVRLPSNKCKEIREIKQFTNEFVCKNGRNPSLQEIKENVKVNNIDTLDFYPVVSFDAPLSDDSEDRTLLDLFEDKNSIKYDSYEDDLKRDIKRIFENFSERDTIILNHYYGLNGYEELSIPEIADKVKLGRERVRQLLRSEEYTLKTLKRKGRILRKYL